jgi:hypothetical protein
MGARYREYIKANTRGGRVINLGKSTGNSVDSDIDFAIKSILSEVAKVAEQITDPKYTTHALYSAASAIRDTMQRNAPRAKKTIKRYLNGKVVATYTAGNLQRSVQIFTHMKDKTAHYVGIKRALGSDARGIFSGSRVDGYYAHMVEYGPRKRPFIRKSVMQAGPDAVKSISNYVKAILIRANGGN